jgi:hypothetical protein
VPWVAWGGTTMFVGPSRPPAVETTSVLAEVQPDPPLQPNEYVLKQRSYGELGVRSLAVTDIEVPSEPEVGVTARLSELTVKGA